MTLILSVALTVQHFVFHVSSITCYPMVYCDKKRVAITSYRLDTITAFLTLPNTVFTLLSLLSCREIRISSYSQLVFKIFLILECVSLLSTSPNSTYNPNLAQACLANPP